MHLSLVARLHILQTNDICLRSTMDRIVLSSLKLFSRSKPPNSTKAGSKMHFPIEYLSVSMLLRGYWAGEFYL